MSHPVVSEKPADHVQRLFVGEDGVRVRGLQACSYFRPLEATGGDFWMLEPLGKTDVLFVFGDITGHGAAAGMVTAIAAGAIEMARLGMSDALRPFMLANLLSHTLLGCVAGEFLLSGVVARYEPATRLLRMVNAGHPPLRVLRRDGVGVHRGDGHPPMGSVRSHRYTESVVQLERGDVLFLFSDGFSEATSPTGQELGERELQRLAAEHFAEGPAAIRDAICSALLEHTGGEEKVDDDLSLLLLTVE